MKGLQKSFFVMVRVERGVLPITAFDNDAVRLYDNVEEAREALKNHALVRAYPTKVYEWGDGEDI